MRQLIQFPQRGIPFHAYLATIARNLIRDRWRQRVSVSIPLHHVDLIEPDAIDATVIATNGLDDLSDLRSCLRADDQTIIRLRVLEERPMEQVAALMRRRPGAIRVLQHRAIVALRAQFEKEPQP